jgi:hypothetical protein
MQDIKFKPLFVATESFVFVGDIKNFRILIHSLVRLYQASSNILDRLDPGIYSIIVLPSTIDSTNLVSNGILPIRGMSFIFRKLSASSVISVFISNLFIKANAGISNDSTSLYNLSAS